MRCRRKISGLGMGVALVTLATGCGGLLKSNAAAQQIYVLNVAAALGEASGSASVSVMKPVTQPGLGSNRIALTRAGNRLDYFADSRWSAGLPQVMETFAVQSLLASGKFAVVVGDEGGARTDLDLVLTIRHFEAEYALDEGGLPRAHVALDCLLVTRMPRVTLGRCDSEAIVPVTANRMGAIVVALEQAAQQAMSGVVVKASALAQSKSPLEGR
jgi:ABC-type uncharacterized transport system auxiliary subunit